MVRTVLDTNVIVAAIRSKLGASYQLLRMIGDGSASMVISVPLILEYEEILIRELVPKFISLAEVVELTNYLCSIGEKFNPQRRIRPVLPDPDDDFLLELAVSAGVEYIVTHNTKDFLAAKQFGVEAIGPGQFLKRVQVQP